VTKFIGLDISIQSEYSATSGDVHENSTQSRQLGKNVIDLVVGIRHLDRDLSEVI
jgi:hypothetical protein